MEHFAIIGLTRRTRHRRHTLYVALLALAVHVLALLAISDWRPPRAGPSSPERAPLIARLIPPELSLTPAPALAPVPDRARNPAPPGVAPRKQRREEITARSESRQEIPVRSGPEQQAHAMPADDAPAPPPEKPGLDWQSDLNGIGSHRSMRYGNVPQSASGASVGSISQPETTAAILAREVSKATHTDCRNAYSSMGLLAIPMLAIDAANRGGCKW